MGVAVRDDALLVAVDGGNSKTDVAVVTPAGRVLSLVRGPGASPHALGIDGALDGIELLIARALAVAGAGSSRVAHTGVYLAGIDFEREKSQLELAMIPRGWSSDVVVDNDTFALLRTGTAGAGIAIVCGAGINCVAVNDAGETLRFPSLGRISGDWGGGSHLSEEVMAAAARDEDGRGEPTALTAAVRRHFETPTVLEAIEGLHFGEIGATRLHQLNPLLFEVAEAGDAVARELVDQLGNEIAALAIAAIRRLRLGVESTPIVLGGGVLAARHRMLSERIEARIDELGPGARFVYVEDRPILGAVLLLLEHAGKRLDSAAVSQLRADLARAKSAQAVSLKSAAEQPIEIERAS